MRDMSTTETKPLSIYEPNPRPIEEPWKSGYRRCTLSGDGQAAQSKCPCFQPDEKSGGWCAHSWDGKNIDDECRCQKP